MDLLIRDMPQREKRLLAQRAAASGRSQSAEALAILSDALHEKKPGIASLLMGAARDCGGVELELPARRPSRDSGFDF